MSFRIPDIFRTHRVMAAFAMVAVAAVAGLASAASHGTSLGVASLIVLAMYFVYVYYHMQIVRAVLDNLSNVGQERDTVLAGASQGR